MLYKTVRQLPRKNGLFLLPTYENIILFLELDNILYTITTQ